MQNLQKKPSAAFFFEAERCFNGLRLSLKKVREDQNLELIGQMPRHSLTPEEDEAMRTKFLVNFKIEKDLNLIGSESPQTALP